MADEPTTMPLNSLVAAEAALSAPSRAAEAPVAELPAAARLRAFEDEEVGADAVRINGQIERGYGSPFRELSEPKQRKYAALEKLIVTEQKLADAHTLLMQADADHEAAEAEVAAADADITDEPSNVAG